MRNLLLMSFVVAGAAGCTAPMSDNGDYVAFDPCGVVKVAVAGDATTAELQSVDEAVQLWTNTSRRPLPQISSSPDGTVPVGTVLIVFEEGAPFFHGQYDSHDGVVIINRALQDDTARSITIAHELGHAFGLPHEEISVRISVMNPGNLTTVPLDSDWSALEALWGTCGGTLDSAGHDPLQRR